jgi:Rieske Fe-S protein
LTCRRSPRARTYVWIDDRRAETRGTNTDGTQVIIKWRGKPVFIRHRTADEIKEAENVNISTLRDPQKDEDRVKKPEWLVMIGMSENC